MFVGDFVLPLCLGILHFQKGAEWHPDSVMVSKSVLEQNMHKGCDNSYVVWLEHYGNPARNPSGIRGTPLLPKCMVVDPK